jgi:hypothetical protein
MRRTSWTPILLALSVLGACQSQDSTKLVITVFSDLAVPAEMDGLHIDVRGQGATHPFDFKLVAKGDVGKTQLPIRLALVPLAAKDEALDIHATAMFGTAQIVWQDAHTAFLPGQARELTLVLGRACIGVTTCGSSLTCANGTCTQPIAVDPKSLPTYVPSRAPTSPDASVVRPGLDASLVSPVDAGVMEAGSLRSEVSLDGAGLAGLDGAGVAALDAPAELAPTFDAARETTAEVGASGEVAADGVIARDSTLEIAPDAPAPDVALDAGPDTAIDTACTVRCSLRSIRCGSTGGSQTCILINGCADWGQETACTGRLVCSSANPSAGCACPAAPAGCSAGTGSFCSTADGSLQTCLKDPDGCVYLGTATVCPAQKPCTGSFPSASCSCPPAPPICGNTTGTFCDGTSSVVTCSHDAQGCLISAPSKSCPAGKPCGGSAGNADCTCPAVAACTSPKPTSGSYCSVNDVVTCSADGNGCAQAAVTTCPVGKPCATSASGASCTCPVPPAVCMNAGTFVPGTSCDSLGQLVTCGTDPVSGCQVATATTGCPSPKTCQGAQGSAACTCPSVPECSTASQMNGSYCSNTTTLVTCADTSGCQQSTTVSCAGGGTLVCAGAYPTAACAGEQTIGSYADQGMQGNQNAVAMVGWSITVTTRAKLERFGVIFKGTTTDRHATLALYANNTASNPEKLLAAAVDKTLSTANAGRNEFAINTVPASVVLDPGTYWLMITVNLGATALGRGAATVQDRYFTQVWGNPLPDPAPPAAQITQGTSQEVNVYIVVLPQ